MKGVIYIIRLTIHDAVNDFKSSNPNVTDRELWNDLKISQGTYYKLKDGKGKNINVVKLQRFCRFFNEPMSSFFRSTSDHNVYIWFANVKDLLDKSSGDYCYWHGVRFKRKNGNGSFADARDRHNPDKLNPLNTLIVIKSNGMTYTTYGRATEIYVGFFEDMNRPKIAIDFDLEGASSSPKFATRDMSKATWNVFDKIISKFTRAERKVIDSMIIKNTGFNSYGNERHLIYDGLGSSDNPISLYKYEIQSPINYFHEKRQFVHFPQLENKE